MEEPRAEIENSRLNMVSRLEMAMKEAGVCVYGGGVRGYGREREITGEQRKGEKEDRKSKRVSK